MRRLLGLLALAAACGGGHKKAAAPESSAAPSAAAAPKLCIDLVNDLHMSSGHGANLRFYFAEEAAMRRTLGVSAGDVIPVWVKGDDPHSVAWTDCSSGTCKGEVALLDAAGTTVTARAPLPRASQAFAGETNIEITWATITGDQLWVYYDLPGKPMPGVGADVEQALAIYSVPALKLALAITLGKRAAASGDISCDGRVSNIDADCDQQDDVLVISDCNVAACLADDELPECADSKTARTKVVWLRRDDAYLKHSN